MDPLAEVSRTIALTMGVAWGSGINLYASILTLGILGANGSMTLPPGLEVLSNPLVIFAAGVMYALEFFADKIPGVDSAWDVLHTFVRIPAGALLAAGAVGPVDPAVALAAGILGGGVAATMHATKAGTRLLINTSPEPFSNAIASVSEDAAVFGGVWLATAHPYWFLALFVLFGMALAYVLPKVLRGARLLLRKIGSFLRGKGLGDPAAAAAVAAPAAGTASAPASGRRDIDESDIPTL